MECCFISPHIHIKPFAVIPTPPLPLAMLTIRIKPPNSLSITVQVDHSKIYCTISKISGRMMNLNGNLITKIELHVLLY